MLHLVIETAHPLAASQRLFLHDLAEERLLLQPASQRTFLRRQVETLSECAGLAFPYSLEVPDITSMLSFIATGLGVAVLPANVAQVSRDLVAVPLMDENSSTPLTLVSASEDTLVKELEGLMQGHFSTI
ncbi:LysR substrate-binding domain-containing protein [Halomonas piscis]|uniref:LysR substrate-binding domain-containing protein n=1 Tax=Halomonas piscis TaxID=3031727 RepID=UPI0035D5E13D